MLFAVKIKRTFSIKYSIIFVLIFFFAVTLQAQSNKKVQLKLSVAYAGESSRANFDYLKSSESDGLHCDKKSEGISFSTEVLVPHISNSLYYLVGGKFIFYYGDNATEGGMFYIGYYGRVGNKKLGLWGKMNLAYIIKKHSVYYLLYSNSGETYNTFENKTSGIGGLGGFGLYYKLGNIYLEPGFEFWFAERDKININLFTEFTISLGFAL